MSEPHRGARAAALVIAALIFSVWMFPTLAASPPPVEAFGSLPQESQVVMSPNGHWLAWLDNKEPKPRVVMFDVSGRKVQRILAVPERVKVRFLYWNDNETLLIMLSETEESRFSSVRSSEYFRVIAHDVSGGDGRMLPMNPMAAYGPNKHDAMLANLVAARISVPHTVIMSTATPCRCLWAVDTRTGQAGVIRHGNDFTAAWIVDGHGRAVAREDWDYRHHAYRLLALGENEADKPREILRKDDSEHPRLTGLSEDKSAVVVLASNGHAHQGVWALPLDGSSPKLIVEEPDEDIVSVYSDRSTGAILGYYLGGSITKVHWLDPTVARRQEVLQRSFPGREVQIDGWTVDGSKTLARVETPSSPPVYYLVDFTAHRADIAAEEYPALASIALGEVKEASYKARDGTTIPAYLTLPPVKTTMPVPLVVLPHGGPQSRDFLEFDWLTQFLASRGYAVLQPQFRGSTGFGDAFRDAGFRQWGGLMQDDVSDGVKAMIEQGIADAHRICIVGASYGGYAALAGAAFTPDLYACAVSISGVTDLPALMRETVPIYGGALSTTLADWKAHIGGPSDSFLAAKSPINSVSTIKIPVLIVYGTGDGVVPNEQSERMARALKSAGKSVNVAILAGEDHWLSHTDTRVQVLKELEAFLHQHL
ncbi:MAG TPA: S9 family peptidase [Steroidobacteraceae bacterium]|nr:S9 family peptidase [Steroidobacteraceae bacterium]